MAFCFLAGVSWAAEGTVPDAAFTTYEAQVLQILDHQHLRASSKAAPPLNSLLGIVSASADNQVIGFAEIANVTVVRTGLTGPQVDWKVKILRVYPGYLVTPGDRLIVLDLKSRNDVFRGETSLMMRERRPGVSARYRPLVIQGFSIGETAQMLWKNESLVGVFGHFAYGVTDWLSLSTLVPADLLQSPNGQIKARFWNDEYETVTLGLSGTKLRDDPTTAINITLYWDSITSGKMVVHTLATFAAATIERAEDTVAIRTAGTSSLQTGYEFILQDWNRILFGPNYNFETKAIGGYVSYKMIWDRFHLATSLSTVNVRELQLNPKTGYFGLVEAYWRF